MSTQSKTKPNKMKKYFKGVKAEMKKVVWPTKKELINYTGVVILITAIISIIVSVFDLGIQRILSLIIS